MKKILLFSLLAGSLLTHVNAQHRILSGSVTDASDGATLPGVTVLEKGTINGTITDLNGNFTLKVAASAQTLVFSFLGMRTQEIAITGSKIEVVLESDVVKVDEVMVVAYGTAKKSNYTGSVSTLNGQKLANTQVSSVSNALQGQVSGVQSVTPSGQPGADATIRIRGVGSINAGSNPLYVVDGIPYGGDLNSINPNDIQSISVLKDAASASLFGSRGANGVIMITTKKGLLGSGEPVINVKASYGVSQQAVSPYKQMTTDQYYEMYWEALRNGYQDNLGISASDATIKASKNIGTALGINPYGINNPEPVGTDGKIKAGLHPLWSDSWQDALVGTGTRQEVSVNVSGGSAKGAYFISGGYLNDQGIALESSFKRYNTRISLSTQAKEWLRIGLNVAGTNSIQNSPTSEDSNTGNVINASNNIPSFYPIYERDLTSGTYKVDNRGAKVYDFGLYRSTSYSNSNLVATLPIDLDQTNANTATIRTFAELTLSKKLLFKTSYGFDYKNKELHIYNNPIWGESAANEGSAERDINRTQTWTFNNVLTYDNTFNQKHHINILAGQEAYSYNKLYLTGARSHFALPDMTEPGAAGQIDNFDAYSDYYSLLSFFGQAAYTLDSKYNFSASIRSDGSSRFSPQSRWGTFWSVGASWNMAQESWIKEEIPWINRLNLKASHGAQGNDQLATYYAYQSLYDVNTNNNSGALVFSRLSNSNLKWETNINSNLGIEYALFNYRLNGSIEVYERRSKDLLFARPIAPSLGLTSIDMNIGSMRNRGIDVDVAVTAIQREHFEWTIGLNLTHYNNVITELPPLDAGEPGIRGSDYSFTMLNVGRSRYEFYLREYAGTSKTGQPTWWKVDPSTGEKSQTTIYSEATEGYHGSSLPNIYGGISNQFKIHQFSISMLWAYSLGGEIYNRDKAQLLSTGSSPGATWSSDILNRWTPENPNSIIPRLSTNSPTNGWQSGASPSTAFLVSASYARLKNLNVGYNLPQKWLNRCKLREAQIFLQGENLFTVFTTQGLDPEAAGISGVTYFRYPATKTLSMGVNLSF